MIINLITITMSISSSRKNIVSVLCGVLILSFALVPAISSAREVTFPELVRMLISIGVITPDKAVKAMEVANKYNDIEIAKSGKAVLSSAKLWADISFSFTKDLKQGDNSQEILTLQRILNSDISTKVALSGAGSPGNETTIFGPATKVALLKFQKKYGISETGIVDAKARVLMNNLLVNQRVNALPDNAKPQIVVKANGQIGNASVQPMSLMTISWDTKNVYDCYTALGAKAVSGSQIVSRPISGTYSMTCQSDYGPVTGYVNISTSSNQGNIAVIPSVNTEDYSFLYASQRPSVDLKVNGQDSLVYVSPGASALVTWTSKNVDSCQSVSGARTTSGSQIITSLNNLSRIYITCTSKWGLVSDTVMINANGNGITASTDQTAGYTWPTVPINTTSQPISSANNPVAPRVNTSPIIPATSAITTSSILGYGPVNHWDSINAEKLATELSLAGLTETQIELNIDPYNSNRTPSVALPKLKAFITEMRKKNIVTFVNLVNGKLGDGEGDYICKPLFTDQLFTDNLDYIIQNIGTSTVILQPTSEWVSGCQDKRDRFINIFKAKWTGMKSYYVGNHSPAPDSTWFKEYHPGSFTDYGDSGELVVTDGGNVLNAIGKDGNGEGFADTAKLQAYACHVLLGGTRGFVYYGYGHTDIDSNAITALGVFATNKPTDCSAYDAALGGGTTIPFGGQVVGISECTNKGGEGEKLFAVVIKACNPGDMIGTSKAGEPMYGTGYITFRENNPPLPSIGDSILGGEVPDEGGKCQGASPSFDAPWIGDASGPLGTGEACTNTDPVADSDSGSDPYTISNTWGANSGWGLW
ncbi:MAG: peptidoglycan-binding domain-containing protein [Candidatus Paceibacterota bacterium]